MRTSHHIRCPRKYRSAAYVPLISEKNGLQEDLLDALEKAFKVRKKDFFDDMVRSCRRPMNTELQKMLKDDRKVKKLATVENERPGFEALAG